MQTFPSEHESLLIEVLYTEGDGGYICGVCGNITPHDLQKIEEEDLPINEMNQGSGCYLFRADFIPAQVGDWGRIELPAYFELTLIDFKPL